MRRNSNALIAVQVSKQRAAAQFVDAIMNHRAIVGVESFAKYERDLPACGGETTCMRENHARCAMSALSKMRRDGLGAVMAMPLFQRPDSPQHSPFRP
ncbi:MAG: hypothetical protein M3Y67_06450 [Pseudomonadota bacterium]|nr:hypothetical protein [Pseudomonadota bacterium]